MSNKSTETMEEKKKAIAEKLKKNVIAKIQTESESKVEPAEKGAAKTLEEETTYTEQEVTDQKPVETKTRRQGSRKRNTTSKEPKAEQEDSPATLETPKLESDSNKKKKEPNSKNKKTATKDQEENVLDLKKIEARNYKANPVVAAGLMLSENEILERAQYKRQAIPDVNAEKYKGDYVYNPESLLVDEIHTSLQRETQFWMQRIMTAVETDEQKGYTLTVHGIITGMKKIGEDSYVYRVSCTEKDNDGVPYCKDNLYEILIPPQYMHRLVHNIQPKQLVSLMKTKKDVPIRFVVKNVDEKNRLVVGDRLWAMELEALGNYIRRRPELGDIPKVVKGMLLNGICAGATDKEVTIDLYGADVVLPASQMDYLRYSNIGKVYYPGRPVLVYLEAIEIENYKPQYGSKTYEFAKCEVSRLKAIPNPNELFWEIYNEGDICTGEIQQMYTKLMYLILDNRVGTLCPIPEWIDLTKNDKISVVIMSKDETDHSFKVMITD